MCRLGQAHRTTYEPLGLGPKIEVCSRFSVCSPSPRAVTRPPDATRMPSAHPSKTWWHKKRHHQNLPCSAKEGSSSAFKRGKNIAISNSLRYSYGSHGGYSLAQRG